MLVTPYKYLICDSPDPIPNSRKGQLHQTRYICSSLFLDIRILTCFIYKSSIFGFADMVQKRNCLTPMTLLDLPYTSGCSIRVYRSIATKAQPSFGPCHSHLLYTTKWYNCCYWNEERSDSCRWWVCLFCKYIVFYIWRKSSLSKIGGPYSVVFNVLTIWFDWDMSKHPL